jgi:hypothetical protein
MKRERRGSKKEYNFKDAIQIFKFANVTKKAQIFGEYDSITPEDWLKKWSSKEGESERLFKQYFIFRTEKIKDDSTGVKLRMKEIKYNKTSHVMKDISNMADANISTMILSTVSEMDDNGWDDEVYIVQHIRLKYMEDKQITVAIMGAILCRIEDKTLDISYITRFWQGIRFQIYEQEKTFETYERTSFDQLLSKALEIGKENGATLLKIELITRGSKELIERHLLERYTQKLWHKPPKVKEYDAQYFPLKYLEYPLCNQCFSQIATVGWENHTLVFCGKECAEKKWKVIGSQKK